MLYCIKFTLMFLGRLVWNLLRSPYLSFVTAYHYTKKRCQKKTVFKTKQHGTERPIFIDHNGNPSVPKKRHRRGHRGGKKHRKGNHKGGGHHAN